MSSRHADVSEALRAAATEKIGRLERFLDGITNAEVHFDQHRNPRIADREICEVTLEGQGHVVRCKVAAADSFAAVDVAVDKLEHQLSRLKSKLRGKTATARRRNGKVANNGVAAVAELEEPEDEDHSMADDAYVTRAGELVVKKKSFAIAPITVDDAVLQMDLVGHSFYFFTNAATGKAAVLYRREDGNLGLIDQD
ncbi:MAG: ribosome-associated translation inhibitor RaiA [Acidimicrobiales bacterium]|nr:ribosome-associated translation inhibitor RaiA [Acidimicrobiales bacterium]